jgi:hypothetical protein
MALATVVALVGLSACGDDDDGASPSTTAEATTTPAATDPGPVGSASAELCTARDELRASIGALTDVDVVRNGTSAITDALTTIKDDLAAVRAATGGDLQPQIDAFQQALDDLQAAIGDSGAVREVVAGVQAVGSTGATVLSSLGNLDCP